MIVIERKCITDKAKKEKKQNKDITCRTANGKLQP